MGNPSPSPPQNPMSTPPSPSLKPKPETPTAPPSPQKKSPPLPWTHQETLNLIHAYQEKWYALKRGQLKASQWEEVSVTVAARCGYDEPTKTATQCRHKIEKLRKRCRAERAKPFPSSWQYFELMDRMERGHLPIAARPVDPVNYRNLNSGGGGGDETESDSDDEELDYGSVDLKRNKLKSVNNIVRGDVVADGSRNLIGLGIDRSFGGGVQRGLRTMRNPVEKRKGYPEETNESDDDEEEEGTEHESEGSGGGIGGKELAAAIRGFAENFMRMESRKIEMMRDTERYRMEMEKRRMEMILQSQRKIVDTIANAGVATPKKVKMAQDM